ncbi:hypothetical protein ACIBG8_53740 [Nonomuraea sp. NPDC050556]|uniref:hypothetical protein n=1 Tax=Nonomuraea sp. NPDC050556 TaxID=3364369 RepID=UPI00379AB6B3
MFFLALALMMPQVTGLDLPAATDRLREAGIEQVAAVPLDGGFVVTRRDWVVCTQSPADGDPYTGGTVTLGVIEKRKGCP